MIDISELLWQLFFIVLLLILGTFAIAGYLAAPWVPLWKKDVKRMLDLAKIKPGQTVVDLGAGDGRILLMSATDYGAKAIGYELSILPYLLGCIKIRLHRLKGKVSLKYGNFFHQNLGQADVITIFLTPKAYSRIKDKIKTEAKPGCLIVSYAFAFKDWQPIIVDKPSQDLATIYVYQN